MPRLGIRPAARRRSIGEDAIIELLLVLGWKVEIAGGDRAPAEVEARRTLNRLTDLGLGFEVGPTGERRFDPAEVANFAQWISLECGDPFWSERCVPVSRRFVWAAHGLAPRAGVRPPPPSALGPRRFTVRLHRSFNLEQLKPGAATRLRLPLPIEDYALRDLDLRVLPDPSLQAEFTTAEARLDVRMRVPEERKVELGFEASFIAHPSSGGGGAGLLDPHSIALYTRPSEGLIKVDEQTRRLAADLAAGERDPWAQIRRFWAFVLDRLNFGAVNYEERDAAHPNAWILQNAWCDCQLGSALLAALCRARGIPARMIGGYVLDDATPFYHGWCEAWVDGRGWTPLDTLSWYFSGGGRDPLWRDYYLGQIDYRMKTECLPRLFNGTGSVRLPPAWRVLSRFATPGLEQGFYDSDTGALVYSDRVAIVGGEAPPGLP